MPDWLAVVILGIIEGITEFLPISSTGHLLLAEHWLPIRSEFIRSELFTVIIQPGAVLAVLALFWPRLSDLAYDWREPEVRDYFAKLLVAFLLTGVGGLTVKKLGFRLPETVTPIAVATLVGGVLFLIVERAIRDRPAMEQVTWAMAIAMGLAQILAAVFPGFSRSGSTILIALAMGLARPQAAEFSFLLGIPTLLAAGAKVGVDALRDPPPYPIDWFMVALGAAVAAVTAFIAVKWLLRFVQTNTFNAFGIYRIIVGVAILAAVR